MWLSDLQPPQVPWWLRQLSGGICRVFSVQRRVTCKQCQLAVFFSSFELPLHLFLLLALASACKDVLNDSGKGGRPCLVPDLRGSALRISPSSVMSACGVK